MAQGIHGAIKRPSDLVARYGGEEFAIILSNTDLGGAVSVAEEVKKAVAALGIPHACSGVGEHVSLSMGVSSTVPRREDEATVLLEDVDKMLYRAKEEGRDRIVSP